MYRILIADDEVIERAVLSKKLNKYFGDRCLVEQAKNGREVLAKYAEQPADVMILDIEMPGISGLEAAEQIRSRDRYCGIIFLTAFDEFSYAKRAISVQATDYLLKPCSDKELIAAVEESLRLHDARKRVWNKTAGVSGNGQEGMTAAETGNGAEDRTVAVDRSGAEGRTAAENENRAESGNTAESRTAAGMAAAGENQSGQQAKILDYIGNHYMEDLSVSEMAFTFGYSEAYFCKLFKQYFGQSFVIYLTEYRVKEAVRLFKESPDQTVSVKDIGIAVGYRDPNYFAKVFKRITGQSPTDYRNHCTK